MLSYLIIFITVLAAVSSIAGTKAKMEKHVADWLGASRLSFFILLVAIIVRIIVEFPHLIIWQILWLILVTVVFCLMEIAFREKRETFGNPRHARLMTIGLILNFLIACLLA